MGTTGGGGKEKRRGELWGKYAQPKIYIDTKNFQNKNLKTEK